VRKNKYETTALVSKVKGFIHENNLIILGFKENKASLSI
jgi:hypothetical protein